MDTSARPRALLRKAHEAVKDFGISAVIGIVLIYLVPCSIRCAFVYIGTLIFVANIIYTFVRDLKPRERIQISKKAVVISGCDTGFGHTLAQRLDDLGFQVFAGCLFPDGDGAQKLKGTASSRLHVLKMDVTKDQDIEDAVKFVDERLDENKLWAVVSNAGLNDGGQLDWTDVDTIKKVLDVNTFGVVRLTKAFLPRIVESRGRVVAMASAAGRYTYPGMVPYCMSKQATVSFCDGLRLEMAYTFGIQVITVEPWMYTTNITQGNTIVTYNKKTWDQAPEHIKSKYPENFMKHHCQATEKFINYAISKKTHEVIQCLEEAITAKHPRYAYSPGTIYSKLSFWFLRRLPKPIADFLINETFATKYE